MWIIISILLFVILLVFTLNPSKTTKVVNKKPFPNSKDSYWRFQIEHKGIVRNVLATDRELEVMFKRADRNPEDLKSS
jgi:hypothetical protein